MNDLADFLLARITEDERRQNGKIGDEDWHEFQCDIHRLHPETRVRYDCGCGVPARVLAECEAKRRIIDEANDASDLDMQVDSEFRVGARDEVAEPYIGDVILRWLALPYADHRDYVDEWRPVPR